MLRKSVSDRHAFSLLEVVLALFVLGIGLAAISRLIEGARVSAVETELQTEALRRAESMLDSVVGQILPLASTSETAFKDAPDWTWETVVVPHTLPNLLAVTMVVNSPPNALAGRQTVTLRTLVRDPQQLPIPEAVIEEALESTDGATTEEVTLP